LETSWLAPKDNNRGLAQKLLNFYAIIEAGKVKIRKRFSIYIF